MPIVLNIKAASSTPVNLTGRSDVHGLIHWIRAHLYGECPECHGTHSKPVYGWDKRQCNDCGCTWKDGF